MFDTSCCPKDLILLAQCDKLGRAGTKEHDYDISRQKLENYLEIYNDRMAQPCVGGKDLIEAGFVPSPLFSEALRMAHNFQVSGTPKSSALPQVLGFMRKEQRIREQKEKTQKTNKQKSHSSEIER